MEKQCHAAKQYRKLANVPDVCEDISDQSLFWERQFSDLIHLMCRLSVVKLKLSILVSPSFAKGIGQHVSLSD